MTETPDAPLGDDDMTTSDSSGGIEDPADLTGGDADGTDGTDADGTDGDSTDSTDGGSTDADGTDSTDEGSSEGTAL